MIQMQIDTDITYQYRDDMEHSMQPESELWVNDEREREQITLSVLQEIAQGHALEENYAQRVKAIASVFANQNPIELILDAAEWVTNDLNNLAKQLQGALKGNQKLAQSIGRDLGFRRVKAVNFFHRLWRFDGNAKGFPGIFNVPTIKQMQQGSIVRFDRDRAKECLTKRVFGKKVIEIVLVPENTHKAAIGTDASVGDIRVQHQQGSFIPSTPAALFVATSAMRMRNSQESYWNYDTLRNPEDYSELDAAQKGLLISQTFRGEIIKDFKHLSSAAMELRQYTQEHRILKNEADWTPIGSIPQLKYPPQPHTLIIRDGRIFPLVHRLKDYEGSSSPDDVLYGTVVQNEIREFKNVFHNSAGCDPGPTYSGAVKSPEFSWLAMLTFWYLHVKDNQADLSDKFYRPPLNDQAVTHLLFWGLAEAYPSILDDDSRNMFRTFQVIRRFSDIAFDAHPKMIVDVNGSKPVNEDLRTDWSSYIKQHIKEAKVQFDHRERGIEPLDEEEYNDFVYLCHRAGVAMFYGVPTRIYQTTVNGGFHFLSPRWEVAIDMTQKDLEVFLNDKLDKLSAWLTDENGLVLDEVHAVGGHEEPVGGLPLMIPDVVHAAHKAATDMRDRHRDDVTDKIYNLIRDIKENKVSFQQ
jgi:hypothetical protein